MFNKKASGEAVSAMIMFIAVIAVTTALVIAFKNYTFETQSSIEVQNEIINNQLRTSISISNSVYNSTSNNVSIYVKNIGQSKPITTNFDFFIEGEYISSYEVYDAQNISNTVRVLEPQRTVVFVTNKNLSSGTYEIKLISGFGGTGDTDYLNI